MEKVLDRCGCLLELLWTDLEKLSFARQETAEFRFSVKMDEHHKNMAEHHAKAGDAAKMEGKLHSDLLAVFTEEQLVKVRPMMKAHMDKCEHMQAAKKKTGEHKH